MTRPKKKVEAKTEATSPDERVAIIHLKGSRQYAEWLEAFHRKTHIAKASLFRLAMAEYASRNGFEPPPEL